jgi:hypothetical protein
MSTAETRPKRLSATHGVGGRLGLQLYFDSSEIRRRDLCSQPPSSPHTRNARSATTMAYLRLDPWPLAMHRNRYDWVPGHYQRPPLGANRGSRERVIFRL